MPALSFHRLTLADEITMLATAMAASDPWRTLGVSDGACAAMLADPSRETWAATLADDLAGCVVLQMQGAFTGYIQSILVLPAYRSQGLGAQLLTFAEQQVFDRAPNMFLCVSSFNQRAQQFYARYGYEVVGCLKDYLVSGHDELLMRKTIAPLRGYAPKKGSE